MDSPVGSSDMSASMSFDDTPPPAAPVQRSPKIWTVPVTPGASNIQRSPIHQEPSTSRSRTPERRMDLSTSEDEPEVLDKSWIDSSFLKKLKSEEKTKEELVNTNEVHLLRNFMRNNYFKVLWGEYAHEKFKDLVHKFGTEEHIRQAQHYEYRFDVMINIIRAILENCQRNMAVMDVSFAIPEDADGLEKVLATARTKMVDVVSDLQDTIRKQEIEITFLKDGLLYVDELKAEVAALRNGLRHYIEEVPEEQEFVKDLQYRLDLQENMNSSLLNELDEEKRSKQEIFEQFLQSEEKRMRDHQQMMREVAEATKHLEMLEVIRDGITAKIKSLTPNPDEVAKAVDEWVRTTQEIIEQKKREVYAVTEESRRLGYKMGSLEIEREERERRIKEAEQKIEEQAKEILEKDKHLQEVQEAAESFPRNSGYFDFMKQTNEVYKTKIRETEELNVKLREEYEKLMEERSVMERDLTDWKLRRGDWESYLRNLEKQMSTPYLRNEQLGRQRMHHEEHKQYMDKKPLETLPEVRTPKRPKYASGQQLKSTGLVDFRADKKLTFKQMKQLTPTMRERLTQPKQRVGSKLDKYLDEIEYIPEDILRMSPPPVDKYFAPMEKSPEDTLRKSPSPLDKYFAPMERSPVHVLTSPSPPSSSRDVPAVVVTPPGVTEPSERTESPIVITTPTVTPFVSKSRFGFTDPRVPPRELNIPPGPFEIATPFRKTVVLTSPRRTEPLLVNIDVDPKPLTYTEKGEAFVCDISLDVKPGGHDVLPQLPPGSSAAFSDERDRIHEREFESPVIKGRRIGRYNVPPDVTPTTTRRHGLFTPRGIFQRRQFNIRRIPGRDPIPEVPWSPAYLPEDARSPVGPLIPSPHISSDRSISWERSPESPSPLIKGPFYGQRLPYSDRTSSSSEYRYLPQDSSGAFSDECERSFDRSHERAFDTSDSPVIKGRFRGRRNIPPDVTPTTARRHGLFTPKGIFKKRQLNIRRIPGKHPISELPWSPTYLPDDARSPVGPLIPSPYIPSDRSISWERSPESTSPIIKGPFYGQRLPYSESSPSPVIKGPFYRQSLSDSPDSEYISPSQYTEPSYEHRSSFSDRSSLSPVIERSQVTRHQSPDSYHRSVSPVIKGPTYRYRSPDSDRSSPSPAISRSFRGDQFPISSPLFPSPTSGYISELEQTGTPQFSRTHDSRSWRSENITPDRNISPRIPGTPDRHSTPGFDSFESEGDYLEESLHDSSLLNETRFLP